MLNELESQNDAQVEGILGKVKTLKDVSLALLSLSLSHTCLLGFRGKEGRTDKRAPAQMTIAIGDEIRDSSALAEKINDGFDSTRLRLRGTMNRMLIMAQRTGVGWKVWLAFFAAVALLFVYVWLF